MIQEHLRPIIEQISKEKTAVVAQAESPDEVTLKAEEIGQTYSREIIMKELQIQLKQLGVTQFPSSIRHANDILEVLSDRKEKLEYELYHLEFDSPNISTKNFIPKSDRKLDYFINTNKDLYSRINAGVQTVKWATYAAGLGYVLKPALTMFEGESFGHMVQSAVIPVTMTLIAVANLALLRAFLENGGAFEKYSPSEKLSVSLAGLYNSLKVRTAKFNSDIEKDTGFQVDAVLNLDEWNSHQKDTERSRLQNSINARIDKIDEVRELIEQYKCSI